MKRSRLSEEPVAVALRQVEVGSPVGDVCRQLGVSEATFSAWKKKYAHMGVSELRRLRQLEEENGRLKRLVADLTLDKPLPSEALRNKVRGPPAAGNSPTGFTGRFRSAVRGPAAWRSAAGPPGIDAVGRRTNQPSGCGFAIWPMPARALAISGSGAAAA
jgi:putative transposase